MSQHRSARPNQLTLERRSGQAYEVYNEAAFSHFLGIERRRAERSGRSLLLLLVDIKDEEARDHVSITGSLTDKVFSALSASVREVDFVGWYRTGRIAGAVLAQGSDGPTPEIAQGIAKRVADVLMRRLQARLRERVQVRVLQLRSTIKG